MREVPIEVPGLPFWGPFIASPGLQEEDGVEEEEEKEEEDEEEEEDAETHVSQVCYREHGQVLVLIVQIPESLWLAHFVCYQNLT